MFSIKSLTILICLSSTGVLDKLSELFRLREDCVILSQSHVSAKRDVDLVVFISINGLLVHSHTSDSLVCKMQLDSDVEPVQAISLKDSHLSR